MKKVNADNKIVIPDGWEVVPAGSAIRKGDMTSQLYLNNWYACRNIGSPCPASSNKVYIRRKA